MWKSDFSQGILCTSGEVYGASQIFEMRDKSSAHRLGHFPISLFELHLKWIIGILENKIDLIAYTLVRSQILLRPCQLIVECLPSARDRGVDCVPWRKKRSNESDACKERLSVGPIVVRYSKAPSWVIALSSSLIRFQVFPPSLLVTISTYGFDSIKYDPIMLRGLCASTVNSPNDPAA